MSNKVYFLDGEKILSPESWLWFYPNKKKRDDEHHVVFIELMKIDELTGDLDQLSDQLSEWKREYGEMFECLKIERVVSYQGGETTSKCFLVGQRNETDHELKTRLDHEKNVEAKRLKDEKRKKEEQRKKDTCTCPCTEARKNGDSANLNSLLGDLIKKEEAENIARVAKVNKFRRKLSF